MRAMINPRARRDAYAVEEAAIVSLEAAHAARAEISQWPGYAPTPLLNLPELATQTGIGQLLYKDESVRLGQGSFKTLGGAYAATLRLKELGGGRGLTLCCATDGNHGRSVAYAAQRHGCGCVVFMHEHAPEHKAQAIAALGAEVVRVPGTYDDSIRHARTSAEREGWLLISDTCEDPRDPTTLQVMQGYGVMVLELLDQFDAPPTHVFLQGGVGSLAAGVIGPLAERFGTARPTMVIVEPQAAAALYESAAMGARASVGGDLRTAMEMLSTGEVSPAAWPLLQSRADVFLVIEDRAAIEAAQGLRTRFGVDVGVSGAAGLAGLMEAATDPELAAGLGLDRSARVLVIGTEAGG